MSATATSTTYGNVEVIDLTPEPADTEEWTIEKLQAADKERTALEAEIKALQDSLTAPGGFGLKGGFVDKEGYPVADYDKVISTKENRQALARKQNDHVALMKRIERGLEAVHQQAKGRPQASSAAAPATPDSSRDKWANRKPVAKVNSVAPSSPAAQAQLQQGDLVLAFGSLDDSSGAFAVMKDIVANSENKPLTVVVRRGGETKYLTLTPKKWSGQGLLGCHMLPI